MAVGNICKSCGGSGKGVGVNTTCVQCGAIITKGDFKVHVSGTNHEEVLKVAKELEASNERNSFLKLLANWSFIIGVIFILAGLFLAYIGSSGDTEFSFFGQTFKSQNVGISSLFLGAVLVVLNIRRVLTSFDK